MVKEKIPFTKMNAKQLNAYTKASRLLDKLNRYRKVLLRTPDHSNELIDRGNQCGLKAVKLINGIDGFDSRAWLKEHYHIQSTGEIMLSGYQRNQVGYANPATWVYMLRKIGIEE